jgi:hypothetical protein
MSEIKVTPRTPERRSRRKVALDANSLPNKIPCFESSDSCSDSAWDSAWDSSLCPSPYLSPSSSPYPSSGPVSSSTQEKGARMMKTRSFNDKSSTIITPPKTPRALRTTLLTKSAPRPSPSPRLAKSQLQSAMIAHRANTANEVNTRYTHTPSGSTFHRRLIFGQPLQPSASKTPTDNPEPLSTGFEPLFTQCGFASPQDEPKTEPKPGRRAGRDLISETLARFEKADDAVSDSVSGTTSAHDETEVRQTVAMKRKARGKRARDEGDGWDGREVEIIDLTGDD